MTDARASSVIAIIPARGGSTRISRKNVREFGGRPLLSWTIDAALGATHVGRVVVSTDDAEIAAVAEDEGVEVPFRRDQHADDHATASMATIRALAQAERHWGEQYEWVTQLLPTCPLRRAHHVDAAIEAFQAAGAPAQISCSPYLLGEPYWAVTLDEQGQPTPLLPEHQERRSQDLPELWCPTGACWVAEVQALRAAGTFYLPGHRFEPIGWRAAVDIDTEEQWQLAEAVHRVTYGGQQ